MEPMAIGRIRHAPVSLGLLDRRHPPVHLVGSVLLPCAAPQLRPVRLIGVHGPQRRPGPVLASRSSAREYTLSKMLASCASGVFVFVVPQVLNLLATMLLVPLIPPDPVTLLFPITYRAAAAELYYSSPLLYTLLFLAVGSAFICLLNCACIACSSRLRSRLLISFLPFLGCMLLNFLLSTIGLACYSPESILSPYQQYPGMSISLTVALLGLLLATVVGYAAIKSQRVDVL